MKTWCLNGISVKKPSHSRREKMHVTGVPAAVTPRAVMLWGQRRWQRSDQVSTLMRDLQVKAKCCREYWQWHPEGDGQHLELLCGGSWLQEAVGKASRQRSELLWFCMCRLPEETGLNHLWLLKKKTKNLCVLITLMKWSDSLPKTTQTQKITKQNKRKHKP